MAAIDWEIRIVIKDPDGNVHVNTSGTGSDNEDTLVMWELTTVADQIGIWTADAHYYEFGTLKDSILGLAIATVIEGGPTWNWKKKGIDLSSVAKIKGIEIESIAKIKGMSG